MVDPLLVVVAVGKGHARDRQAELILLLCAANTVVFVGQHFADKLEADLMIVFFHLAAKRVAPQGVRPASIAAHVTGNGH